MSRGGAVDATTWTSTESMSAAARNFDHPRGLCDCLPIPSSLEYPLPGRCLAEMWLLHPHKMHPIKKRGLEPSEEHTERRSELPTDETPVRPTERLQRRTTAGPTGRAASRPTDPITDGAIDPPSDGTNDRASGRPHARPLDRAIELRSDRRCGRPSELTTE